MSMFKAMVQKAVDEFRTRANGQVVLVLRGDGALGAYHVGVYEALAHRSVPSTPAFSQAISHRTALAMDA